MGCESPKFALPKPAFSRLLVSALANERGKHVFDKADVLNHRRVRRGVPDSALLRLATANSPYLANVASKLPQHEFGIRELMQPKGKLTTIL
jgi:hypothetical protein